MRLQDRVAVVTGGGRGIGASTCRKMAAEGARMVVLDLDGPAAQRVASECAAAGRDALAFACDVSNRDQVGEVFASVHERFGRLDILVNNAGVIRDNLIHKMTDSDWDLVMNVHLKGAFICSQTAQRYMVSQKYGRIISMSSSSSLGNRGQANYSAAKAGLQGFTRTLAVELGRFGITVNAVAPGFVATDMARQTAERLGKDVEAFLAEVAGRVPLGRVCQPEDVANVIAFLASDEAGFVSGQIIYVCGGPEAARG